MVFYSKKELSQLLSMSTRTIDRLIFSGKLKSFKIGRSVRISQNQLDDFLKGSVYDPFENNGVSVSTGFNL